MNRHKLMGRVSTVFLTLGVAAVLAGTADAGVNFDGIYSIEVTTDVGACAKTYQGTVTIQGGHVVATSHGDAMAYGLVATDGTISLQFHEGQEIAHVAGYAKGVKAQGTWSAPVSQCGGRWRAERRS
jgi:hypothetical protein